MDCEMVGVGRDGKVISLSLYYKGVSRMYHRCVKMCQGCVKGVLRVCQRVCQRCWTRYLVVLICPPTHSPDYITLVAS